MKFILLIMAASTLALTPSCETFTPEKQAAIEQLVDLGVETGTIQPGTAILVKKGTVVISNLLKKNEPAKEIPLAKSPLAEAVKDGHITEGETLVSHDGQTAVILPPAPDPLAPVPNG